MTIIAALILFSIIVLIHELGHFIFAKRSGIKVNEFSIGMGPKIYSVKRYRVFYKSTSNWWICQHGR